MPWLLSDTVAAPTAVAGVEVVARRGAAKAPPEVELGEAEIDALGAYDIGETVDRIAAVRGLGAGPVVIINGRRALNAAEYMGFPPDALDRVEILRPEAAGLYGADPSRRVVNLVLKRRFDSLDARLSEARPTAGGRSALAADARRAFIAGDDTRQFGARASRDSALRAGERDVYRRDHPGDDAVTLRPAGRTFGANLSFNRALGDWTTSLGVNGRTQADRSTARRGAGMVDSRRRLRNLALTAGAGGELAGWSVRLGVDGQLSEAVLSGVSDTASASRSIAASLGADRRLLDLPAGPVQANLSGRASRTVSTVETGGKETRRDGDTADLQFGLAAPLARASPGAGLGDVVLSLGASRRQASGTGGGAGMSAGLSWTPLPKLRLNGAWSRAADNPTNAQRFDPVVSGEPTLVFDFRTGQAVRILPILGGNPALVPQEADRVSLGVSAGPLTRWTASAAIAFEAAATRDGVGALPAPTLAVEAAFPERFQRDGEGRLVGLDQRPINIRSDRSRMLSSNLGFGPPFETAGTSLRVSLSHAWRLESRMVIREGLPAMDRLAGDGGGAPRHELAATLDGRRGRWSVNATARWRQAYRIRRDVGRDGPDDLRLAAFAGLDLKLGFLQRLPGRAGAGRADLKLVLEVENLFDARPRARLGDGRSAPAYGRDDQDPLGRVVRMTAAGRF
ncbi:TonB-dependent receptor [Caulobacter radicis]|nr:TonB-dependent receptor [Caulobacter radicis]